MTTPGRDIAAESAASVANLQGFMKNFHAEQAKYLAITAVPAVAQSALRQQDRLRAANAKFAAENQDQLFQIRKQLWIQNKLLSGWTMDEVNEEIAAGEELVAAQQQPTDPFPWGSTLFLVLVAIGVVIALVYGFTHPNDGVTSALGALTQ